MLCDTVLCHISSADGEDADPVSYDQDEWPDLDEDAEVQQDGKPFILIL